MPAKQSTWWLLTLFDIDSFSPTSPCHPSISNIAGQLECCSSTGRRHWQLVVAYRKRATLSHVKQCFGSGVHAEISRSAAARAYVWKDDTAVPDTRFDIGVPIIRRNNGTDWAIVRKSATTGQFDLIPDDIFVRCYHSLKSIRADHATPLAIVRTTYVFWGPTGTGKSRKAWEDAGVDAYPKDPRTKWWCGYRGQKNIVIDEFRGDIDISHILRWLDRYPVSVETKGSSIPLAAKTLWITSNLSPDEWYPTADQMTKEALDRRLIVVKFDKLV